MKIVVDTSVIISVIANEEHKEKLIELTYNADLFAPSSLHWEIGNAFSAMLKRERISLEEAKSAINYYKDIPIRFFDINLESALELSNQYSIYAYDSYFLICAIQNNSPLLTLDMGLIKIAKNIGIRTIEVKK